MTYNVPIYNRQGDGALVVGATGKIVMQTGAALVGNGETQGAHVADVSVATIAWTTGDKAKVNTILARLESVGINATS